MQHCQCSFLWPSNAHPRPLHWLKKLLKGLAMARLLLEEWMDPPWKESKWEEDAT